MIDWYIVFNLSFVFFCIFVYTSVFCLEWTRTGHDFVFLESKVCALNERINKIKCNVYKNYVDTVGTRAIAAR